MMDLIRALHRNNEPFYSILLEMKMRFEDGDDPEEILSDYGLEPDYVMDVIGLSYRDRRQIAISCLMYLEKDER